MPLQYAPPPRYVPLSLRIVNFFNVGTQAGWGVFGFGMIFVWVFTLNADLSFLDFRGEHYKVLGKVTDVRSTGASENHQQIYAHHYEYSVAGSSFNSTSYAKGNTLDSGTPVTVEYDPANPSKSRIEGMRRGQFSPAVLFVVIFPLVGLAILIPSTIWGRRRNHLLENGIFTTGKLLGRRPTNMTVNKRPVIELVFEFTTRDGRRCEATARTTNPQKLEDEAQEPLLYDPENPEKACLLDEAPARPKVEMNGQFAGRPTAALFALVIPTLVIVIHGMIALIKFR
jgi:hypothetical protein